LTSRHSLRARTKFTLSYAAFVLIAGLSILLVVWLFLLRYVPDRNIATQSGFVPNRSDLVDAFAPAATIAILFLIAFGLIGGWFLAGRMLAPLHRITAVARAIARGSFTERVTDSGPDDEFRELALAFNYMLDRIDDDIEQQRRFVANASHELRTPLAVIQTVADAALSDPSADASRALSRIQKTNARAIDLTEALLLLSRLELEVDVSDVVDLSLAAEEAEEALVSLGSARGVELRVTGDPAYARGSSALLTQVATNLIHNAIVHNLPEGGTVHVLTGVSGGWAQLIVENTGSVVPRDEVSHLTEPFLRSARHINASSHNGAGLGLAIVKRVVDVHRGTLRLSAPATGGLVAEVQLPLA